LTPADIVLINVQDLGIKTIAQSANNETTNAVNNSDNINYALFFAKNKILFFPDGEYYFNKLINMGDGNIPHKIILSSETILKPSTGFNDFVLLNIYETKQLEIFGGSIDMRNFDTTNTSGISGISYTYGNKVFKIINITNIGLMLTGEGLTHEIKNITIERVETISCKEGGIFMNSVKNIKIIDCINDGGVRAIGVKAPIIKPNALENIFIENCSSKNTTGFGIQSYYGKFITISKCYIEGFNLTEQDHSIIIIDRSNHVEVTGNMVLSNSTIDKASIFVTGSKYVNVLNNQVIGGFLGISSTFNFEQLTEDPTINESEFINISNNTLKDNSTSIDIIGSLNVNISNNICDTLLTRSAHSITICGQEFEGEDMISGNVVIMSNICNKDIQNTGGQYISNVPINYIGNICSNYIGVRLFDFVLGNGIDSIRLGNKQLENLTNIKRNQMSDDQWISEFNLDSNINHKGMRWKYQYE
jgi:hypothetical protein